MLTSQACGAWLEHVLRRGWPLLSGDDLRRRGIEPEPEEPPQPIPPLAGLGAPLDGYGQGAQPHRG